jgi:putative component of membrane protein insertase Oxa1/YidC/SpoIIIJ protein YidD
MAMADLPYGRVATASDLESAQDLIPWEKGEVEIRGGPVKPDFVGPQSLFSSASTALIRCYQRRVSANSVARCPFVVSCSDFALQAVQRHGFLMGLCLFIDRSFYRENPQIGDLYPYRQQNLGLLRLDDSFYLDAR